MTMTRRRWTFPAVGGLLVALLVATLPAQRQGQPLAPDLIYYNAKIVTVDDRFSYAQAIAMSGDKFTDVGTSDAVRRLAGPKTQQVDLHGMTVIPGLTDN